MNDLMEVIKGRKSVRRGGANLYRYGSQGTARGSRVQNREIEDGGYVHRR